jgi:hypothetical protein
MTHKEFINKVTNSHKDFIAEFISILKFNRMPFCVIGGLAVNAYVEPVVSLDLDVVVVVQGINNLIKLLRKRYKVSRYPHSINVAYSQSDLRIQIQIDPRYQSFIEKARVKNVLGYRLPVALIGDVFQGKIWAAQDPKRRPSKRQKDLSDIQRMLEVKPALAKLLPQSLKDRLITK